MPTKQEILQKFMDYKIENSISDPVVYINSIIKELLIPSPKSSHIPAVTPEQEAKGIVDNLEGYKIIIDEEKIMDDFDMIEYNSL